MTAQQWLWQHRCHGDWTILEDGRVQFSDGSVIAPPHPIVIVDFWSPFHYGYDQGLPDIQPPMWAHEALAHFPRLRAQLEAEEARISKMVQI